MPALATGGTGGFSATVWRPVSSRLATEFLTVPIAIVDRCVADVWACTAHLGLDPTCDIVERVAREHLLALVHSAPRAQGPG